MDEPAVDIYEVEGWIVVEIALPGVIETDIDITLHKERIVVRAERPAIQVSWLRREIHRGEISR